MASSDLNFPSRQCRGPVALPPERKDGEYPDRTIGFRRRMRPGAAVGANANANAFPGRTSGTTSGESEIKQDINEQRLIYKCRLDPSTDNSGYAGVTRVVRKGGTAWMDNNTLVIENASSVMLLTRIEWFSDYSEDKVETLRLAVEQLTPDYNALLEQHARSSRRLSIA